MFNVVKYGDFNQINEAMLFRHESGASWDGLLNVARRYNNNTLGTYFPSYPLTLWCIKNFETSVFLRNFDQIIKENIEVELAIIFEILLVIKNKFKKN